MTVAFMIMSLCLIPLKVWTSTGKPPLFVLQRSQILRDPTFTVPWPGVIDELVRYMPHEDPPFPYLASSHETP